MSGVNFGRIPWAIAAVSVVASSSTMASAQQAPCAPRPVLLQGLHERHGEVPVGFGIAANGNLLEIVAAPFGSWTALITQPTGVSCAVLYGSEWRAVEPPSPSHAAPSE